jgi:glutathione S-transferase
VNPPDIYTLFHSPGSCSLASLIALEASGLSFDVVEVNTGRRENFAPDYLAINLAGKVPALRLPDGNVLTENPAILAYIADLVPERALIPAVGTFERARAHEWLNYLSSGVHIAFRSVFRPERMTVDPGGADAIRMQGRIMVRDAMQVVEARVARTKTPFLIGSRPSVCDFYLLVYHQWCAREIVAIDDFAMPHVEALAARILDLAEVKVALGRAQ